MFSLAVGLPIPMVDNVIDVCERVENGFFDGMLRSGALPQLSKIYRVPSGLAFPRLFYFQL